MNALTHVSSAWLELVLIDETKTNRLVNAITELLKISPSDLTSSDRELLAQIPLDLVRTFGKTEMINYVEAQSEAGLKAIAKTIAAMHLRQTGQTA